MNELSFVEPHSVCRVRHALSLDTENIVSQEHAYDSDVTVILARYQRTGVLPAGRGEGIYGDVSELCGKDYAGVQQVVQGALKTVEDAQAAEAAAHKAVADYEASVKASDSDASVSS